MAVGAFRFPLCDCLFVGGQDPGEQGAKAPCSPLSFHCRIVHFPLSIFNFRAYRRKACPLSVVAPTGGRGVGEVGGVGG